MLNKQFYNLNMSHVVISVYQCLFSQRPPGGVSSFPPVLQLPEAPPSSSHLETEN